MVRSGKNAAQVCEINLSTNVRSARKTVFSKLFCELSLKQRLFFSQVNTKKPTTMDYIPKSLRMQAQRVSDFQRNRFRIENLGADSSGPNKIVTVNLPTDCLIDSKSLKLHCDVACSAGAHAGETVHSRLPADAMSLVQRLEVYINGVQVTSGASEYNSISRILKIARCSRDRDGSVNRALSHGAIDSVDADESVSLVLSDWVGILGECSTRYLPTQIMGSIQIRLTFADESVLVPCKPSGDVDNGLSTAEKLAAANMSYSVSNMYWTVDTIQVSDQYDAMLRARLQSEEYISLNYKEYLSFSLDGNATGSHQTRFHLSTQSLDKLYGTCRDSSYRERGQEASELAGALTNNTYVANHFNFQSFESGDGKSVGNLRTFWRINNIQFPQYRQTATDELFNLAYCARKSSMHDSGNLVTSLEDFNKGLFVSSQLLCDPDEPISTVGGMNSRGVNTSLVWDVSGQNLATGQSVSTFVVAETTASLRIGLSQSLLPVF